MNIKLNIKDAFLFIVLITFLTLGIQIIPSISKNLEILYIAQTPDFLNIAKTMVRGGVLYTDASDHKGLYTFIPFVIANHFNNPVQIIRIMEQMMFILIIVSCFCFYKNQTNNLTKTLKRTILFTIVFTFFTGQCVSWLIAEGFLCIVLFWLFIYINNIQNGADINKKQFISWGIIIGYFLFSKYTIILYFLPFFCVLIAELIKRRINKKELLFFILHGCLGILITSIIPVLYCIIHDNFGDMIEAMSGCVSEDGIRIIIISMMLGLVCCVLASRSHYNNKYNNRNIYIFLACFLLNFATLSLPHYLIIPFVVILHCIIYRNNEKMNIGAFLFTRVLYAIILIMMCINISAIRNNLFAYEPYLKTPRELAETYDINNSNILYMKEDIGFGAWSDEPYQIKYQWIPDRFFKTGKGLKLLERDLELIKNNEFEYIFFVMPEPYEIYLYYSNKLAYEYYCVLADIQNELDNNYYCIEPYYCPMLYRSKAYIETTDF